MLKNRKRIAALCLSLTMLTNLLSGITARAEEYNTDDEIILEEAEDDSHSDETQSAEEETTSDESSTEEISDESEEEEENAPEELVEETDLSDDSAREDEIDEEETDNSPDIDNDSTDTGDSEDDSLTDEPDESTGSSADDDDAVLDEEDEENVLDEETETELSLSSVEAVASEDAEDGIAVISDDENTADSESETSSSDSGIPDDAVTFNGHYYYYYDPDDISGADDAIAYCEALGGHLATITSAEEDAFLYNYITSLGYYNAYFGLTDRDEEGTWVWITGEEVTYTNWASGEGNNSHSNEDWGMYYYKYTSGKWNDGDFSTSYANNGGTAFLCEWDEDEVSSDDDTDDTDSFLASLDLDISKTEVSSDDTEAVYEITATVTNTSYLVDLTNVYATFDPMENGKLVTDYGEATQSVEELAMSAGYEEGNSYAFVWRVSIDRTEYADGGTYFYMITYGADQVDETAVQGAIALDAVNGESNELDFSIDVWSFKNFSDDSTHNLTDELYEILLNNYTENGVTSAVAREEIKQQLTAGSNGHCFGMSATVILNKMNVESTAILSYTGTDTLWDASLDDEGTNAILCYYQLLKGCNNELKNAIDEYMNDYTTAQRLTILSESAAAVADGGTPVLLGLTSDDAGHAVVAFGLEEGEFTSSASGKTYDRRVLIYDSNSVKIIEVLGIPVRYQATFNYDYCLLFNYGTDEWEIPYYVESWGFTSERDDAELVCAITDVDIIGSINLESEYRNYIATLTVSNDTALTLSSDTGSWTIDGKNGSVVGTSSLTNFHETDMMEDGESGDRVILLPKDASAYTLTTTSGETDELALTVLYEDSLIYVDAEAAQGISFDENSTLTLMGNEGDFEIRVADDNVASGSFDTYYVTGNAEGDISVTVTDSDISITGNSLSGITIQAFEDDVTDTLEIEADVENVIFGRSADDTLVCENHIAGSTVTENVIVATSTTQGSYDEVVYCIICGSEMSRETIYTDPNEIGDTTETDNSDSSDSDSIDDSDSSDSGSSGSSDSSGSGSSDSSDASGSGNTDSPSTSAAFSPGRPEPDIATIHPAATRATRATDPGSSYSPGSGSSDDSASSDSGSTDSADSSDSSSINSLGTSAAVDIDSLDISTSAAADDSDGSSASTADDSSSVSASAAADPSGASSSTRGAANTQTGDDTSFPLWIGLLILSASGLMSIVVIKRRRIYK